MQNPLNPDAGYVQVPADPETIKAVLRAANVSFRASPYYRLRWGERGRRFAFSDSGWLSTLMGHMDATAVKQTLWLGRVLSNRGMPSWLLERHLGVLHRHLLREGVQHEGTGRLLLGQAALREQRLEVCDEATLTRLARDFSRVTEQRPHPLLDHVGLLLTTAVIDECNGMRNAVTSVNAWMLDEARWPASWVTGCYRYLDHVSDVFNPE